jgi:phosphoglycolate phosphatase
MIKAIFFDLDGTLADTAPDLAFALNWVRQRQGHAPLPYSAIRPWVSHGGREMIRRSFGSLAQSEETLLWQTLITVYRQHIAAQTQLFNGMAQVLAHIENQQKKWGVVTNKSQALTEPLMCALNLQHRSTVTVSGDSLKHKKPHPEPLYYACKQAQCHPNQCLYVGDALRDIQAGRAAGIKTAAAAFGYLDVNDNIQQWGADYIINQPLDLLAYI